MVIGGGVRILTPSFFTDLLRNLLMEHQQANMPQAYIVSAYLFKATAYRERRPTVGGPRRLEMRPFYVPGITHWRLWTALITLDPARRPLLANHFRVSLQTFRPPNSGLGPHL